MCVCVRMRVCVYTGGGEVEWRISFIIATVMHLPTAGKVKSDIAKRHKQCHMQTSLLL